MKRFFASVLRFNSQHRIHHGGFVLPGFERVADAYKALLTSGQEQGSSFAVFYKGEPVVDLWGGYADRNALRYRKADSTTMAASVTKAVTAICMAHLYDKGLLDYDCPVAKYWPEFGQKNKQDITVNTLLCHRAGLFAISEKHELSLLRDDPDRLGQLLAQQEPFWTPGTGQGYHGLTFALYADQLIRRIDPKRRSLGKYFREEIAETFDIDFMIGESKDQFHRACRHATANFGYKYFFTTTVPTLLTITRRIAESLIKYKKLYITYLIGNPTDWKPAMVNNPDFREIECGSSHGFGTARGLAKLMGILANGGRLHSQVLLSSDAIKRLGTPLSNERDRVALFDITIGPGMMIHTISYEGHKAHTAFGHQGAGGQMAYCDPEHKVGWAYLTNYANLFHGFVIDHRYAALEKAMYQCIYELHRNN